MKMRGMGLPLSGKTARISGNKTRQGYARERTLKPAGYFFVRREA